MPRKEYTIAKPVAHALFDGQESFAEVLFPETALAEEESFDFSTFGRYGHLQPHFAKAFYVYGFEKHPATRKAVYDALKRFFEFLDVHNAQGRIIEWPSDLTRDVFDGYRRWLLARQSQAGASVYYNTTRRIVNCLKRVARDQFTTCEFPRFNAGPGSMPRSGLTSAVMERIVAAACEEARCVWEIFQRGQQLVADARKRITFDELMNVPVAACAGDVGLLLLYICEVYGGVVPIGYCNQRNGKYDWRLIEAVAAHGGVNAVSRYLHATAESLAPFLILIGDGTWANADALLHFRRDCMRADEVFPFRVSVLWDKPRARREQRRCFDRRKSGSVPRLIEQVLALTERLVPFARKRDQNALFLARGSRWIGVPANESNESVVNLALQQFVTRHGLRDLDGSPLRLRLSDLRPTAMKRELHRGRDLVSVQRLANHQFLSTTVRYVEDVLSEQSTRVIAAAQESLYDVSPGTLSVVPTGMAEQTGVTCSDPTNGRGGVSAVGQLCPNWLTELLNPNLIIPGDPKYIARLLQVRQQLLNSREYMVPKRFELLYCGFLDAVESALAHFDEPILEQAHELLSGLPPLLRLDVA